MRTHVGTRVGEGQVRGLLMPPLSGSTSHETPCRPGLLCYLHREVSLGSLTLGVAGERKCLGGAGNQGSDMSPQTLSLQWSPSLSKWASGHTAQQSPTPPPTPAPRRCLARRAWYKRRILPSGQQPRGRRGLGLEAAAHVGKTQQPRLTWAP